ncbi:hypothetical protein HFO91_18445 [Rhizobium leguminosarum]|uniref:hypothetical protein n=1 Tax=Rhizobium leguminosarum TaxID=384 RepID=UPI001C96A388|nr:hypothetical protein [Rhizobium leguminosarum]MBY5368623.1 hypothetical protein [Rhizobium leguminosarum]MBY5451617.1 hypothetical protein [Rhizobium leguminosarum]
MLTILEGRPIELERLRFAATELAQRFASWCNVDDCEGNPLALVVGYWPNHLHLQNGGDNDAVLFVSGTALDIRDMHRDAVTVGSKYAVRHWIVAPHEVTSREQMAEALENWRGGKAGGGAE